MKSELPFEPCDSPLERFVLIVQVVDRLGEYIQRVVFLDLMDDLFDGCEQLLVLHF
jgi:hypothetical protein